MVEFHHIERLSIALNISDVVERMAAVAYVSGCSRICWMFYE